MASRAKVEIDGKEINAFLWRMTVRGDFATIKLSCYQHNGPGLSLCKEGIAPIAKPIRDLTLTDSLGTAIKCQAELTRIESHEEVGAVPSVDYFFTVKGE